MIINSSQNFEGIIIKRILFTKKNMDTNKQFTKDKTKSTNICKS